MSRTVTYVEMTGPEQLRPSPVVDAVGLERVDNEASLLRDIVLRVGAPHAWRSVHYSDDEWREAMSRPGLRHWLIVAGGSAVGVAGLQEHGDGEVEITKFGLVPEAVGRGYGGAALTQVIRLAWSRDGRADGAPVRRVWLHTSSQDHPHALRNYQRRGMRPYLTQVEPDSGVE